MSDPIRYSRANKVIGFGLFKMKTFISMILVGPSGSTSVKVNFREVKLKILIRDHSLLEPNISKSVVWETTKPSYPPCTFQVFSHLTWDYILTDFEICDINEVGWSPNHVGDSINL